MKSTVWAGVGLLFCIAFSISGAEKVTTLTVDGREMREIHEVHLNPDGRVIILYGNTGATLAEDKLPDAFLESWGIERKAAREMQARKSKGDIDRALAEGAFREVDGVVYDIRKPQAGWVQFVNVKMFQIIDDGALVDPAPHNPYSETLIFVSNLPQAVGDTDRVSFWARQAGTYSYINKAGFSRTVRAYDFGITCKRSEVPDSLIAGTQTSAKAITSRPSARKALSKLPENEDLKVSGSGFFITEDGYLITNFHVVENANTVKVKSKAGLFPAKIIKTDSSADLALLKLTARSKPLSISNEKDAPLGETVFTIGFPNIDIQGVEPKYTDGKVSSLMGLHDDPTQYQISVPVQPGNSGGALVDSRGNVVGVVVARLSDLGMLKNFGSLPQNVNYAIKAKVLRDFLKGVAEVTLPAAPQIKAEGVIKNAEEASAMVLVY